MSWVAFRVGRRGLRRRSRAPSSSPQRWDAVPPHPPPSIAPKVVTAPPASEFCGRRPRHRTEQASGRGGPPSRPAREDARRLDFHVRSAGHGGGGSNRLRLDHAACPGCRGPGRGPGLRPPGADQRRATSSGNSRWATPMRRSSTGHRGTASQMRSSRWSKGALRCRAETGAWRGASRRGRGVAPGELVMASVKDADE